MELSGYKTKPLYGFMQDKKSYEDAAHILIGLIPMWGWFREHNQWPPGDTIYYDSKNTQNVTEVKTWLTEQWDEYAPHDRVRDVYRDSLGYAVGSTIRFTILTTLLIKEIL